jgi:cobyrinic acid a,c-diamide synthase
LDTPRVLVAGVRGGSGKTLISLGLLAAWRRQGHRVAPFKKGPDYIDAAWLALAAGRPCRNLDLFLMSPHAVLGSIAASTAESDVAVIEGNRGLYDGMDAEGSTSTAELAKLLQAPVVLSVDCTKATRTVAAVVLGCQRLDPQVPLAGVILNRAAGPRHESVLREAVEGTCGLPVVGVIPKIAEPLFPERHLGLVPPQEHGGLETAIERAAELAEEHLDLQAIRDLAAAAPALEPRAPSPEVSTAPVTERARIGVFRDAAFQFYYPENLEALERQGARLIEVSPIRDAALPHVDALYIGGGFPETLAPALAENKPFLESLRQAIEVGLPVYAECGGTVYLGEKLLYQGKEYAMVGALPVAFAFRAKPQGHGYTVLETVGDNPFYAVGETLRGHEFHYTYMQSSAEALSFAFRVTRGFGFDGERDGLRHRNVLACYTHIHALGTESWAPALVRTAARFGGAAGSS